MLKSDDRIGVAKRRWNYSAKKGSDSVPIETKIGSTELRQIINNQVTKGKELVERIEILDGDSSLESPDIVIVDHLMPELHGLDAAARLKNRRAEIPFVVITAFGNATRNNTESISLERFN